MRFKIGDHVRKINSACWQGWVVGTYSTDLIAEGYCVASGSESGSVQLYPGAALAKTNSQLAIDNYAPPVVVLQPSIFEQVARRFDTYADDQEAMLSRTGSAPKRKQMSTTALTWRDAAKELRGLAASPKHRAEVLEEISGANRDWILEYLMGKATPDG